MGRKREVAGALAIIFAVAVIYFLFLHEPTIGCWKPKYDGESEMHIYHNGTFMSISNLSIPEFKAVCIRNNGSTCQYTCTWDNGTIFYMHRPDYIGFWKRNGTDILFYPSHVKIQRPWMELEYHPGTDTLRYYYGGKAYGSYTEYIRADCEQPQLPPNLINTTADN